MCNASGSGAASPRPQPPRAEQKSPLMFLAVVAFYGACAITFNPRLLPLFDGPAGLAGDFVVLLFLLQLNVFWLFGGYFAMLGVFTIIDWLLRPPRPRSRPDGPPVAILYATMNDFQECAALSCLEQDYVASHLFILDDSVDPAARAVVNEFAALHDGRTTVIRRSNREGYKAGSLNSALRHHIRDYPYFIVVDADSVLPPTFTSELLPYFDLAEDIGWVQASHAPNPVQKSAFAEDLALGILPLWEVYYGPRNRFGNVIFLGHGGMIRYDVWQQTGGFPEIVSEDLAFSTRAAQLGYRGYFAHDVVSYEDFPEGYRQLRRQQAKYVKGACEYLHREFVQYLRSPRVRWFEKFDVLLSCGSLLVQPLVLTFIILFCLLMPLLFGEWRPITLGLFGRDAITIPVITLGDRFGQLWRWDYFLVTLICTFAPVVGCFSVIARQPRRGARMYLVSAIPYLSLIVMSTATIVSYVLSRRAVFLVTGDRWGVDPKALPDGFSATAPVRERIGAEDRLTNVGEAVLGSVLAIACVLTFNISLLAYSLALVLGPVLLRVRWDAPLLRPVLFVPYALVLLGLMLGGANVVAAQGAFMAVFFFHF